MKTSKDILNESLGNGVSNHYTPIQNIIINVRNLYAQFWGLVVTPGEDGVSIKITGSEFTSKERINDILYSNVFNSYSSSLASYIISQGLTEINILDLGASYVVYFSPNDIKSAEIPMAKTCTEMLHYNLMESEMSKLSYNNEEELEDNIKKDIAEIFDLQDKIQAASQFDEVLSHKIQLPEGYYIKAVKDSDGNNSIALRKKFEKRRPFGKTIECTKSLINIFNSGKDGIWIDDFDNKDNMNKDDVALIENILDFIGAVQNNNDLCVWGLEIYNNPEDNKEGNKPQENEDQQ